MKQTVLYWLERKVCWYRGILSYLLNEIKRLLHTVQFYYIDVHPPRILNKTYTVTWKQSLIIVYRFQNSVLGKVKNEKKGEILKDDAMIEMPNLSR